MRLPGGWEVAWRLGGCPVAGRGRLNFLKLSQTFYAFYASYALYSFYAFYYFYALYPSTLSTLSMMAMAIRVMP